MGFIHVAVPPPFDVHGGFISSFIQPLQSVLMSVESIEDASSMVEQKTDVSDQYFLNGYISLHIQ
ncbi:hypothetical protein DPMN_072949 [Dreissena polymorpha]|uniref:Uncharacterized protein n=1 Tax=Dreissena polymorpha TaxID=45954 RepID=A0A9D4BY56_DREPO|nr:hypothetical protein DPMN_072949 [Dreissena polymorpha]